MNETLIRSERDKIRSTLAFKETAKETYEPIRAKGLWRYTASKILVLGTNDALYILNGLRRYKLRKLQAPIGNFVEPQPLDKVGIRRKRYFTRIAKELDITPEEAYNLSQELARADYEEFMSNFSEIAKERGITPEEVLSREMEEADEFLFQIEKERIAEVKELKQFQQTPT